MKKLLSSLLLLVVSYSSFAVGYDQLKELNAYWNLEKYTTSYLPENMSATNEVELIQAHLSLVENNLRNKSTVGLNPTQIQNRNHALDILHAYWQKGIFPINLYHAERTPYFIDHKGTACAVGQLIIETGYRDIAEKINKENNYGYIKDLCPQYPEILDWANEFGFTEDELAWIQPTYSFPYNHFGTDSVPTLILPSCIGTWDGKILLPDPTSNYYPAFFTPPLSVMIGPGGPSPFPTLVGPNGALYGNLSYQFTIKDANNYIFIRQIFLPNPPPINIGLSLAQAALCAGDTATINVSAVGGTGAYNGTGFFPRTAGTHSFTVSDSNGCLATNSILIVDPPMLSTIISSNQSILCNGDSTAVTISASGGTLPYLGTGTITLSAGTHNIQISDSNACTADTTITITQPPPILVSDSVIAPVLCNGGAATINVSATGGIAPYTNTGSYTFNAGTNTILITDSNGCTTSHNITITEPSLLSNSFYTTPDDGTNNGSVKSTVLGGTPPYNYQWSNSQTTDSISGLSTGWYSLQVTDANGCTIQDSVMVQLEFPTWVNEIENDLIKIYPNPTIDKKCQVQFANIAERKIIVHDVYGKTINIKDTDEKIVDLGFTIAGLYFIEIIEGDKQSVYKILVD